MLSWMETFDWRGKGYFNSLWGLTLPVPNTAFINVALFSHTQYLKNLSMDYAQCNESHRTQDILGEHLTVSRALELA